MTQFCVALIGGIGSGKSTAANFFKEFGAHMISADKIARELSDSQVIKQEIKNIFGPSVFDDENKLDRTKLASIVFGSRTKKNQLEEVIHPKVRSEIIKQIKNSNAPYCIIEIPVFSKREDHPYIKKVLCISCTTDQQIQHTVQRDGRQRQGVEKIIGNQLKAKELKKLADDVIDNTSTLTELKEKCLAMHNKYLGQCHFS